MMENSTLLGMLFGGWIGIAIGAVALLGGVPAALLFALAMAALVAAAEWIGWGSDVGLVLAAVMCCGVVFGSLVAPKC